MHSGHGNWRGIARLVGVMCALFGGAAIAGASSTEVIDGQHPRGEPWRLEKPANWNGTLLLYSHGYSPVATSVPPQTAPRGMHDQLVAEGYALAASAYTGTGWALEEAPRDQLEVVDAFTKRFGKPTRTIAWGDSMGGLVTLALAERQAVRFDGALPMCGSVSGSLGMLNTALDGAFAFRTLLAPDSDIRVVRVDDDRANATRVTSVLASAWSTPQGRARVLLAATLAQLPHWSDPTAPEPAPDDFAAQAEQIRKTFVMGVFVPRVDQERRAGGLYSWNNGIDYRDQLQRSGRITFVRHFYELAGLDMERDLAALNSAPRITADPGAVAYMRANYVPSGSLPVPVLTLHTSGDGLTIPATHGGLRTISRDAGRERQLAQLWVRRAGHCTFTSTEIRAALGVLERRLDTGEWPSAPPPPTFTDYQPEMLLRGCGARPGSCAGEPAPAGKSP
jgi:pimeloyl-ACP methyl ester carboxylesterase